MTNMDVGDADVAEAERFIGKWKGSAASELSTSQSFLIDLCELLGVDRPHATAEQDYMFERPLTFQQRSAHGNDAPAEGQTRDDAILERLVALNAERAAEEARGHIRWLRPEFQNPQATPAPQQAVLDTGTTDEGDDAPVASAPTASKPIPWPKDTIEQVRVVADLLTASPVPLSIDDIGNRFTARGPWKKRLPQLVEMLVALGRAEIREGGVVGSRH